MSKLPKGSTNRRAWKSRNPKHMDMVEGWLTLSIRSMTQVGDTICAFYLYHLLNYCCTQHSSQTLVIVYVLHIYWLFCVICTLCTLSFVGLAYYTQGKNIVFRFIIEYTSGYLWPLGTVKFLGFFKLGSCFNFFKKLLSFSFFLMCFLFLLLFCIIKIKCFFFTFIFLFIWMQVWSLEKEDTPHSFSSKIFLHI